MADTDEAESSQDLEAPEEELDEAMIQLGTYAEARRALPMDQWTFKEKANFYLDRLFLGFLFIVFLILIGECVYKVWYVTNLRKIAEFVSDSVVFLFDWLSTQERKEELLEL